MLCLDISDWGFVDKRINEVIAVSEEVDGFNVAPMGVVSPLGSKSGYARLWRGSNTLKNVKRNGEVTVCFTADPVVYARGAIGNPLDMLDDQGLVEGCDAWIRCDAVFEEELRDKEVEKWELKITEGEVLRKTLFVVNRGFNSVIEAAVHATRVGFKPELEERIRHHLEICRKCGGEREREAADILEGYLEKREV